MASGTILSSPKCNSYFITGPKASQIKVIMKIKVYCDSGADINCLESFYLECEFYQFPYDSPDRNKKLIKQGIIKLAVPSEAQWRDSHQTWEESNFSWNESSSHLFTHLAALIKQDSKKSAAELRRDVLHLDSAYKMGCHIFITSDMDILSKRLEIEALCKIQVFQTHKESPQLIEHIKTIISKKT
jgi:hypothetical protein